ncbi:MAG: bifunctional alpha,alpha-trehalose-phosphate synthase (UDP-forming)/trehalose-phosphatase [Chthoniobacterales bacterium]
MSVTTIINVSNRLPVTVGKKITKSSGGLVAALEGLSPNEYELKWIGWPGATVSDPARQAELEETLARDYGCIPIFLSKKEVAGHYEGFSNSSVWPLLHYMPNFMRYAPAWWEQYRIVNQRFADKVLALAKPGNLVWVHDYQLMLMPAMLHERMPELKIGFFLHTPFPSFEIFRCHPKRREILAGLLGADLIGFHTFGYMRHFRSTVLRLLGLESEMSRIRREDGHVSAMGVFPIGINAKKFEETLDSPAFAKRQKELRASDAGKRVVVSVERMDYTKGILHRLDAIEHFLAAAKDRDAIKFIFVSVPSREEVLEYKELRAEVEARVGRINGHYATLSSSPIRFIHGSVNFVDLCALYANADIGLVTPLIDGMNLVAKEYIACQREHAGVLILSEFAGAAEELSSAILVNPYDARAVAQAIADALALPEDERRAANQPMRERVLYYDAQHWARVFIESLIATAEAAPLTSEQIGDIVTQLRAAATKPIALFLDYDGTLREIERDADAARPTPEILDLLRELAEHSNFDVTIISGRKSDMLEAWFGGLRFNLVAEHGAAIRRQGQREWTQMVRGLNLNWKNDLRKVLEHYEQSTPGSHVEEKNTSLVWHYRKTDPEFGAWKANQLVHELGVLMANQQVSVRHGRKIVEATAAQISKGAAIRLLLDDKKYAAILCAGDDSTDESMFEIAAPNLISFKVGGQPSHARYRLSDPAELRKFLRDALLRES